MVKDRESDKQEKLSELKLKKLITDNVISDLKAGPRERGESASVLDHGQQSSSNREPGSMENMFGRHLSDIFLQDLKMRR